MGLVVGPALVGLGSGMARIAYDGVDAAAFAATRELGGDGLAGWRAAVERHIEPRAGVRILDVGAGTGSWARSFADWFPAVDVVAVEPAAAMRARSVFRPVMGGDVARLPLAGGSADVVWLSTVVHHVADLRAAAREIRRVLRPGGVVLIRSAFAGRHAGIALFRFFPEAVRVLDTFPSVAEVAEAFATAGFRVAGLEAVAQVSAGSLGEVAATLRRAAHTPLQLISDAAYAAGLERLRAAAAAGGSGPVVDQLDLLVLRPSPGE